MASPDTLAAALAALGERPHDALAALLDAWRAAPRPELAAVIEAVSARIAADPSPLRGRSAEALATWTRRAARPGLADIPPLLATLTDVPSGEATSRIEQVVRWPADPRVEAALLALLDALPFQAKTTRPFWRTVFERLRATRDASVVSRLERQLERIPHNTPPTTAQWFCGQLRRLIDDLQPLAAAPAPPAAILRDLERAAGIGPALRKLDDLLAAIHANPDDDAPRLVYADALLERGDPRGELITLQCRLAGANEPVLRLRERELLREHGDTWLGPLAPIVLAPYVFDRGFLAMATVDGRKLEHVRRLATEPSWATIRRVAIRLTQPVDVAKTIDILRALPTTIRQIEVTAHGLAPAGLAQIRAAAERLRHLEYCNVSS